MRRYVINKMLGQIIKKARKNSGMTQEQLAEKVGMHYTSISRIETGYANPPVQTINKIAKALKIKVNELIPF